jgi:dihydroorotase
VVFDPHAEWTVDPDAFHSRGRNTPFAGWRLRGRVLATLNAGRFTHVADGVQFERPVAAVGAAR